MSSNILSERDHLQAALDGSVAIRVTTTLTLDKIKSTIKVFLAHRVNNEQ